MSVRLLTLSLMLCLLPQPVLAYELTKEAVESIIQQDAGLNGPEEEIPFIEQYYADDFTVAMDVTLVLPNGKRLQPRHQKFTKQELLERRKVDQYRTRVLSQNTHVLTINLIKENKVADALFTISGNLSMNVDGKKVRTNGIGSCTGRYTANEEAEHPMMKSLYCGITFEILSVN